MEVGILFNKRIVSVTVIILLIFISTVSFADDLSISRWTVDSTLMNNGDLNVIEDITFDFRDEFNGVYRSIVLKDTDGVENLQIFEMREGFEVPYNLVNAAEKGDKEVFTSSSNKNSIDLKIFSPSGDEKKTFRIKYTVKNVATIHKDTGELYYQFIGDENKTYIDYFSGTIKLPDANKEKTKIFAHGPLNGNINFIQDDLIKLEVSDMPSNTYIEARILFPKNFIENSEKTGNNSLQSIVDEELSYIENLKEKAEKQAENKSLFNYISLGIIGIIVAIVGFIYNKLRRSVDIYDSLKSLSPEDITPAELRYFFYNIIDGRSLMSTIFDFSRRGYIDIEEIDSLKKKKNKRDFKLIKKDLVVNDLLEHEIDLLDWIFNVIGDGSSTSTIDIDNYRKKSPMKFNKELASWQDKVRNEVKKRGYYDDRRYTFGTITLFLFIFSLIMGIVAIVFNSLYGIALIVLSVLILIYSIILYCRKSNKGYIQYKMWKDFKKDMERQKDISKDYNIKIPKDKTLIYALALGLPMKSIDGIRENISETYTSTHWIYWYFLYNKRGGSSFEDSLNSSFYGAGTSTSTSSSIGSGGGFSSGGGGGAGGGGAGGF